VAARSYSYRCMPITGHDVDGDRQCISTLLCAHVLLTKAGVPHAHKF
jgi:hypothetical protein